MSALWIGPFHLDGSGTGSLLYCVAYLERSHKFETSGYQKNVNKIPGNYIQLCLFLWGTRLHRNWLLKPGFWRGCDVAEKFLMIRDGNIFQEVKSDIFWAPLPWPSSCNLVCWQNCQFRMKMVWWPKVGRNPRFCLHPGTYHFSFDFLLRLSRLHRLCPPLLPL